MTVPPACWNYLWGLLKNTGSQTLPSRLQGSTCGARPGLAPPVLQSTLAWGVLAIPAPCICRCLTYPRRPFPTRWTPYSPFEAQFKCSPSSSKPGHSLGQDGLLLLCGPRTQHGTCISSHPYFFPSGVIVNCFQAWLTLQNISSGRSFCIISALPHSARHPGVLCACVWAAADRVAYLEDKNIKAQIVSSLQKVIQCIKGVPSLACECPEAQPLALAGWQGGQLSGLGREHWPRLPYPQALQ